MSASARRAGDLFARFSVDGLLIGGRQAVFSYHDPPRDHHERRQLVRRSHEIRRRALARRFVEPAGRA